MKTKNFTAATLAIFSLQMLLPSIAIAEGCRVSALDTIAGLGTEVRVEDCGKSVATTLTVTDPNGQEYTQDITLDAVGNAATLIPSKNTTIAGRYTFTVGSQPGSFTVMADRADEKNSLLQTSKLRIAADGKETVTVTAVLRDRYDNPVSGRRLALIASRLADDVDEISTETDDDGRYLWSLRSTAKGTASLSVYDVTGGKPLKLRADVAVGTTSLAASLMGTGQSDDILAATDPTDFSNADLLIDHFEIELPQGATSVKANELFSITVRAMRGDEVVRGYIGTLTVTSSDDDADLPRQGEDTKNPDDGRIDIRGIDQGIRRVPLAFVLRSGGKQTIDVFDRNNPDAKGTITLTVTGGNSSENGEIVILDPADRSSIKSGPVLLQGRAPSLINLEVIGGATKVQGETDTEGVFRISVPLNPQDKEVTLFVRSENGTYESNPVHIIIDTSTAEIKTINLPEAKAESQVTIEVISEPNLKSVTAKTGNQTVDLSEDSAIPGTYHGLITAPPLEGTYDVTVVATDTVGNAVTMLTKWNVKPKTMAIVQGLTAEGQQRAVLLKWQPIENMPVQEYKIYIAADSDPANQLYSIATGKPVTSAVIKDLPPNRSYRFTVTAIGTDGSESPEKSQPAIASSLGMDLTALPGNSSILLQWSKIPDLPLDHYIVQYGTDAGVYTEKRSASGDAQSIMLHDLLSGVSYEFSVTPVDVTGKIRDDLTGLVRAVPGGTGFTTIGSDPVPDGIFHGGAPDIEPDIPDVPSNAGTGVATPFLWAILGLSLVIGLFWKRMIRERRLAKQFLLSVQQRYHS